MNDQLEPNTTKKTDSEYWSEVREKETEISSIPPGYITVELSTKGRLYAPKKFHVRNWTTESLFDISLVDQDELPVKICEMLQELILEKDVDVRHFHEKEVIETIVTIYKTFYDTTIHEIDYEITEDDWKWLAERHGGRDSDDFRGLERDYKAGRWKPKYSIDLTKVGSYVLPETFKYTASVKKSTGFTCKYSLPFYGDALDLREFIKAKWQTKDRQFEQIERMLQFKEDAEKRWRNGENINLSSIPQVSKADMEKYRDYAREKTQDSLRYARVMHLVEYKGQNVRDMQLEKKVQFADDPELDYPTYKKIEEKFDDLKFGLIEDVDIINPVTNLPCKIKFPFRIDVILASLDHVSDNGITVDFE